jgi:hypothetical protein
METQNIGKNLDYEKIQRQWVDLQSEREKERKFIGKLITTLKKSIQSGNMSNKLDKLFDYLTE